MKESGTVKWFNNDKGYGYITVPGNARDVFVHYSEIQMEGHKILSAGQKVEFEREDTSKGPKAKNVKVVE